jgi:hypothetical protein
LVEIVFAVDKIAIAYVMQLRGIRDFAITMEKWEQLFRGTSDKKRVPLPKQIESGLDEEYQNSSKLKEQIEQEWKRREADVLAWLKELTNVDFKEPQVKVCVVPFGAGMTPSRRVPLIVVGKIRKGWGYPETIAHELAHVLFNQNFESENDVEHPYVQLIEEEIAVRLGARSRYFDYEIPAFAVWVHEAQRREKAWRHYLQHIEDFTSIAQFVTENEGLTR